MSAPERSLAIDAVRGGVMVLMVLDHARDFFFGVRVDPTDLDSTTPVLFFTRWVTHFCAPGFVLLAGAAAYLYGEKRSAAERRRFLFTRGLWLVVLEVTVVRFGWVPEPFYRFTLLQVIWAIGWSMVILAPLSVLSPKVLVALGAAMVATHNVLDPIEARALGDLAFPWAVVNDRELFEPAPGHLVAVSYPLVPWVGVMALGFGLGALFARPAEERQRWLLGLGVTLTAAFPLVRALNVYGDPRPWSSHPDGVLTMLDFLDCEKYPPSLAFLLMTLGPILLALWAFDRFARREAIAPLLVIGAVPLFFYVAHLYVLRFSSIAFAYARWGMSAFTMPPEGHAGSPEHPLWSAYLAWIATVLLLYPACRWYGDLKRRRAATWWWLRYL